MKVAITKHILKAILWLFILTFALLWIIHNIWEKYSHVKDDKKIWTYTFIAPKTPEFHLWEPLRMISKSTYWAEWLIIWQDYYLCASDFWQEYMTDIQMDEEIINKKHRRLETTFSERKRIWEFWWRWDEDNDWILDWEWIFGWENTIDWKKFYKTSRLGDHCYIRSYQTFWYNGIPKKQRFTSWPFNIIK